MKDEVVVSVDVANTGKREGDEVVQVYARFSGSTVERPAKKLVGFQRVTFPRARRSASTSRCAGRTWRTGT